MTAVSVPTGHPYEVLIGSGLLDTLGSRITELRPKARTVCLVSDTNVRPASDGSPAVQTEAWPESG